MQRLINVFRQWRYLCLLVALVLLLVVQPLVTGFGTSGWLFDTLFVFVMVVLVLALVHDKVWRRIALLLCVPAASLSIGSHFLQPSAQQATLLAGHGIAALFFVLVTGKIVHTILTSRQLSVDSIFGTICGYLLLGIAWGLAFATIHAADPASFQFSDAMRSPLGPADYGRDVFLYYSFITLTTVGYGDISPLSPPARTLAWVEAMTGQLYLAVLIAGLVSSLIAAKRR
jgi:voltage-gated potassium channel